MVAESKVETKINQVIKMNVQSLVPTMTNDKKNHKIGKTGLQFLFTTKTEQIEPQ